MEEDQKEGEELQLEKDQYIIERKTFRQQMGEFRSFGEWKWINSFSFVCTHIMNGVPRGYVTGSVRGKNLTGCAVCGTGIVHHYTLKNEVKGELNVGVECLGKILGEKKGDAIKKTVASIRRQVRTDIVRPIKVEQLNQWLQKYWAGFSSDRNVRIDHELKEDPKRYWMKPHEVAVWNPEKEDYDHRPATDKELSKYAEKNERDDRNFWSYNKENFVNRGWSPDTMKKVYKEELEKENYVMDFKWRKLTQEEQNKISELTSIKVNNYVEMLKKRGNN